MSDPAYFTVMTLRHDLPMKEPVIRTFTARLTELASENTREEAYDHILRLACAELNLPRSLVSVLFWSLEPDTLP